MTYLETLMNIYARYDSRTLNAYLNDDPPQTYEEYLEENNLPSFEDTIPDEDHDNYRCHPAKGVVHEDHDWKADGRCSRCKSMLYSFWVAEGGMTEEEFDKGE